MDEPTTPERNRAQARASHREQQELTSPQLRRQPSNVAIAQVAEPIAPAPAPVAQPAAQPNRRALAQQARRERERNQRGGQPVVQANAPPMGNAPAALPVPPAPVNIRSVAQQARRARERERQEQQAAGQGQLPQIPQPEVPFPVNPLPQNNPEQPAANNVAAEEPPLPPNQIEEALEARAAAKAKRNRKVERLWALGRHNLGGMDKTCEHCNALHWDAEKVKARSNQLNPKFGSCCSHGKIQLALPKCPPVLLWQLYTGSHPLSTNFFDNIRQFNAALAFVSMGTDHEREIPAGNGPYVYKIGGSVYHRSGDLAPAAGQTPRYAQLYVYDSLTEAANIRSNYAANSRCDRGLMQELTGLLHQHHRYVEIYKQAWEMMQGQDVQDVSVVIRQNRNDDRRRYNRPTSDEIALVFPDNAMERQRDIRVYHRNGGLQQIDTWNPAYSCLHYVLLYPFGEHGFQRHIPMQNQNWVPGQNPRQGNRQQELPGSEEEEAPNEGQQVGEHARRVVSERQYYRYILFPREKFKRDDPIPPPDTHFSTLFRARRLFHQMLVDAWAIIDQSVLQWFKMNQDTIRADLYRGVVDSLNTDDLNFGHQIGTILPSSYYGGSRQMHESYQDAMGISRHLGPPQLFITMTANPNWPEIKAELLDGQTVADRPDLAVRVFELKRAALLSDITKEGVLGRCTAHVHTIEFQKRGLPHMHLLVWLDKSSHITSPADVDELISAEIPDPNEDPELYETVTTSMMHGPCGPNFPNAPCWDPEKQACKKGYWPLKPWAEATTMVKDAYPNYRRSDNGRKFKKRSHGQDIFLDSRSIVPFNRYLSKRFNCHINVEICGGISAIKYVFKYVYKGHDRASIELSHHSAAHPPLPAPPPAAPAAPPPIAPDANPEQRNEIKIHLDSRWVSSYEALWRIFSFRLHQEIPNIIRLQVHLEDHDTITFRDGERLEQVVQNRRDTTLLGFFKLNQHPNPETRAIANDLLYQEVPNKFSWNKKDRVWKLRRVKRPQPGDPPGRVQYVGGALGRMYFAGPNRGPRFYLRLLLTVVKGATSFQDLRTHNGIQHPTDHAACIAQGLLENDNEWATCLTEAAGMQTGFQLRKLFVVILINCNPSEPMKLWNDFKQHLCDDLKRHLQRQAWAPAELTDEVVYDYGLFLLEQLLEDSGSDVKKAKVQKCQCNWAELNNENRLIQEQYQLLAAQPEGAAAQLQRQLNHEQQVAFDAICLSVREAQGKVFFLDGPAGTGKTFLYTTLCYTLRAEGYFVICVASSGIAALLLPGGRTSHSRLKIPRDVHETSVCLISKTEELGQLIKRTKLIVWDEVPMQHRFCAEAFSRTAQDICSNTSTPFGGITMVFGGDFRQTLPVIPKGTPEQIISACLKYSPIWQYVHRLRLTQNMRLQGDPEAVAFAAWLLQVGEGLGIQEGVGGSIEFPQEMLVQSRDDLIHSLYPGISAPGHATDQFLLERTILAGRNDDVMLLNTRILEKFPGELKTFNSADSVSAEQGVDNPETAHLSPEYLNSLNSSSIPVSCLKLKVGVPIMVMRNLAPAHGVCNGSRGVITNIGQRVLEVRLLGGTEAGKTVFIPRITLETPESDFGFILKRRQFPVRLAFAMTINKSQGQSVKHVGLDLEHATFSHGQLYVALSRCTSASRIRIFNNSQENKTRNVVYKTVLSN